MIIILFILLFIIIGYLVSDWWLDRNAPEERVEATCISVDVFSDRTDNGCSITIYRFIFDINGTIKIFSVNKNIYEQYHRLYYKQKGILVYKRNKFVDFII